MRDAAPDAPSTSTSIPLTNDASSDTRNAHTAAISSAVAEAMDRGVVEDLLHDRLLLELLTTHRRVDQARRHRHDATAERPPPHRAPWPLRAARRPSTTRTPSRESGSSAAARSTKPSARGSCTSAASSSTEELERQVAGARREAHRREPSVTSGSNASSNDAVPTRLTSTMRPGSAMVGDRPAGVHQRPERTELGRPAPPTPAPRRDR